ncbi:MAG: sulfotransferase domain-containing protein [Acidobacteriia bacterium]|nr:sulfotransferase domain-containing protein [Terriglobia bacterium]
MIARIIAGTRQLLELHHPGRNLVVFPDDVFIVSYPKSGNTWTRFLIANLVHPEEPANFANINRIIPDPEALSKRELGRLPRPRYIKSHQYFDPRYQKIVYVVRDPRDVALSQYHFHRKRRLIDDDYPKEKFVTLFVAGETSVYGSWGENVASWVATRHGRPGFLLLRYEDMMENAMREMAEVASFLGIAVTPERLARVVELSSADEMRKLEAAQAHMWSSTKDTRQDVPFVRAAKSGGWRAELPESAIAELETAWAPLMQWLSYELSLAKAPANDSRVLQATLEAPRR